MGGSKKSTSRERALILLGLLFITFYYACTELAQTHWRSGFGALLLVFAFVVWIVMTKVRSHCGVLRSDGRGYCRNRIKGLLFGCHLHTWDRPLALLGFRSKAAAPARGPRPQAAKPAGAAAAPIPASTAEERERRRNGILFYVTIGSLITGSLSTFTDLFGFFKGLA